MNDKQHAEVMDALHTIGRNIAHQESATREAALGLRQALAVTIFAFGVVAAAVLLVAGLR